MVLKIQTYAVFTAGQFSKFLKLKMEMAVVQGEIVKLLHILPSFS